jgi:hypothetical protein
VVAGTEPLQWKADLAFSDFQQLIEQAEQQYVITGEQSRAVS